MSVEQKPKYWIGPAPAKCDTCEASVTSEFSDIKTIFGGVWGTLCPDCVKKYTNGYGYGRGQRYQKQPDGRWLKVEG